MERAGPRSRCTAPGMIPSPGGSRLAPESSSPGPKSTNKGDKMLEGGRVATRMPAQDLERARTFYAEKLGLEPSEERPGGLLYRCASGEFALFESTGAPAGTFTQMAWQVEDIETVVEGLRGRGVVSEEYDVPCLRTAHGIAEGEGKYPSKGTGERAA